ncbi:hypothetical protein AGLY_015661 [Aphis glycines]|uniref:Uncharacterized protein n=1 Tax=Aphis glycines TaxID=307491 RepID=A0A6G0T1D6_APHGL|nr:hypothetical protein AGLY_015661 [Aphis glycines]
MNEKWDFHILKCNVFNIEINILLTVGRWTLLKMVNKNVGDYTPNLGDNIKNVKESISISFWHIGFFECSFTATENVRLLRDMHSSVGALHCDSTARPYKIGVVDERGIAKYNATFCTVTTVNRFLTYSMLALRYTIENKKKMEYLKKFKHYDFMNKQIGLKEVMNGGFRWLIVFKKIGKNKKKRRQVGTALLYIRKWGGPRTRDVFAKSMFVAKRNTIISSLYSHRHGHIHCILLASYYRIATAIASPWQIYMILTNFVNISTYKRL